MAYNPDPETWARFCYQAGFRGGDWIVAVAIIGAESGWDRNEHNVNDNGSVDNGGWMINNRAHPEVSRRCAYLAKCSTHAAFDIFRARGFKEWRAYETGAHLDHMPRAQRAVERAAKRLGVEVPLRDLFTTYPEIQRHYATHRGADQTAVEFLRDLPKNVLKYTGLADALWPILVQIALVALALGLIGAGLMKLVSKSAASTAQAVVPIAGGVAKGVT